MAGRGQVGISLIELVALSANLLSWRRSPLETRLGPLHAQLRLDIEREHEAGFWSGAQLLHLENWPLMQATIEIALRVTAP